MTQTNTVWYSTAKIPQIKRGNVLRHIKWPSPNQFYHGKAINIISLICDKSVKVGKPEGNRQLGRPRRRWVDNIRMGLKEVVYGYMDWIGLAQDRESWRTLVNAVMNLRVPWNARNFLTSCKQVSFSRRTLHHGVSKPVPVAARSKAKACGRSSAEISDSSPIGDIDVCCECCVLSGWGLCDELIPRPEESYRLWCVAVCDLQTSWMRMPWPNGGAVASKGEKNCSCGTERNDSLLKH